MSYATTYYRGSAFRRRIEARWAVFFDQVGIRWDYHPQGFNLIGSEYYMPSFYLYFSGGVYAEAKLEDGDFSKSEELAKSRKIVLLAGLPRPAVYWLLAPTVGRKGELNSFSETPVCFDSKYLCGANKDENRFHIAPDRIDKDDFSEEFEIARSYSFYLETRFFNEFE